MLLLVIQLKLVQLPAIAGNIPRFYYIKLVLNIVIILKILLLKLYKDGIDPTPAGALTTTR